MNKKYYVLPMILLISAALLLSGCGKNNTPAAEQTPETKTVMSWDTPPAMEIDTSKSYKAEITTNKGNFTIELFAKDAPKTVNNFVFLSKQGYYNDVIFHRIIESFMIQTGDREGTGMGGPGYQFENEKTDYKYEPGIVAMANAGKDTNGSQFFICTGDNSISLNRTPNYTIFGKITTGMDVVKEIAATPVDVGPSGETSSPTETIQIKEIKIIEG
ncbi:Peptidyl-prolyl cis-trans isomerase (rotamase)-cyclophilin family [Fontibacillus panacisegetis]|uniref:Peptidyl-prolyl cis-trans isomerase n=1 Tax=Fontibacillus panacisegetis TaxID=670482 RepID=A0A1G7E862_9BACL|nr:peptidylprolyl isomerase [Fontibacillus panacisegetis]SDE59853.1 Peptidyl-prolyl cis-trans isomerase (rotamase)-cyclophilin family [Fontibacillus panacisegetis]